MNDREIAEKGRKLAAEIISLNQICDRSKMDTIEIDRLDSLVKQARTMFADPGEYEQEQDDKSFT